ncbi:hypothetical protein BJV78DRAFT_1154849 [Lactifluus subvellereus]|nr:hypothetical protein BJV78DRAFT_1154849 [Lactifluus subvellereus]
MCAMCAMGHSPLTSETWRNWQPSLGLFLHVASGSVLASSIYLFGPGLIHVLATTDSDSVAVVQLHVTKIHQMLTWQTTKEKTPSLMAAYTGACNVATSPRCAKRHGSQSSDDSSSTLEHDRTRTQRDTHDRSSIEVEQILPPNDPAQDPRDFYAPDSPVFDYPDSDQELYESAKEFEENDEPEGRGDGVASDNEAGSNARCFSNSLGQFSHPSSYCHSSVVPVA